MRYLDWYHSIHHHFAFLLMNRVDSDSKLTVNAKQSTTTSIFGNVYKRIKLLEVMNQILKSLHLVQEAFLIIDFKNGCDLSSDASQAVELLRMLYKNRKPFWADCTTRPFKQVLN